MKRRELITGFSSILAALSVSSFSSQAADKKASVSLKDVSPGDVPKQDVPVLTPENIYTMPDRFWKTFSGKLYIGKAGTDPTQAGNLIDVFLKMPTASCLKLSSRLRSIRVTSSSLLMTMPR